MSSQILKVDLSPGDLKQLATFVDSHEQIEDSSVEAPTDLTKGPFEGTPKNGTESDGTSISNLMCTIPLTTLLKLNVPIRINTHDNPSIKPAVVTYRTKSKENLDEFTISLTLTSKNKLLQMTNQISTESYCEQPILKNALNLSPKKNKVDSLDTENGYLFIPGEDQNNSLNTCSKSLESNNSKFCFELPNETTSCAQGGCCLKNSCSDDTFLTSILTKSTSLTLVPELEIDCKKETKPKTGVAQGKEEDSSLASSEQQKKKKKTTKSKATSQEKLNENESSTQKSLEGPSRRTAFACVLCSYKGNCQSKLDQHMVVHTGEKKYTCKVCGKKFKWASYLLDHERMHSAYPPFQCKVCKKIFCNKSALDTHMSSQHNPDGPAFQCQECGKLFKYSSTLRKHAAIHLEKRKKFICEYCGKDFVTINSYTMHLNKHTGEKPFSCEVCGMKFDRNDSRSRHIRQIHKGIVKEKKYQCTVCGKMFRSGHQLKNHFIRHTDERPFKCKLCSKTFRSYTNLKSHKNMHLGVKPYSCGVCGRTFLNYCNKIKHQRRHSNVRPHQCNFCEKAFYEKQELARHVQRHHNQIENVGIEHLTIMSEPPMLQVPHSSLETSIQGSHSNLQTTVPHMALQTNIHPNSTHLDIPNSNQHHSQIPAQRQSSSVHSHVRLHHVPHISLGVPINNKYL